MIGSDGSERNFHVLAFLPVGKTPASLALKPDTGEIFATNFESDTISEIVTGDAAVNATYSIGSHPSHAIVSADNSLLYVSNFGSNNVAVFSIENGRVLATVNVGTHPDALALSMNQNYLFVADSGSNDVAVVLTRASRGGKPTLLTVLPVGARPSAVVVKAFLAH
ncbi:MAG: hypothetical protein NVS9B15_22300 [Acidobacteriaceae bacterium]